MCTSSSRVSAAVDYSDELLLVHFLRDIAQNVKRLPEIHWSTCNGKSTQYTSHFRIYCFRHWFVYQYPRSHFSLLQRHRSIATYFSPSRLLRPTQFRNCFTEERMAMVVQKKKKRRSDAGTIIAAPTSLAPS